MRRFLALGFMLSLVTAGSVPAQPAWTTQDTGAQFRDAAIATATGRLYAAVYDRDEVWVYDPGTLERLVRIPVGDGPSAIAISHDGAVVACVNRLAATVSFISTVSDTVTSESATGDGPVDVAALPDGRFAVANSFSDNVSIHDPRAPQYPETVSDVPAVPIAVAAMEKYLVVAGRAETNVRVLALAGGDARTISMPGPVTALGALPDNRVVAATADQLTVVNAATGKIIQKADMAADDVMADGERVLAIAHDRVSVLDANLAVAEEWKLPGAAQRVAAGGGVYVVLSPQQKSWQVWNATGRTAVAAAPASAPVEVAEAAPPATITIEEAAPVEVAPLAPEPVTQEPAGAPVEEAQPVEAPVVEDEPAETPPAEPAEAQSPEAAPAEPEAAVPSAPEPQPPVSKSRRMAEPSPASGKSPGQQLSIVSSEVRAPKLGRKPSAVPLQDFSGPTLAEALNTGADFGPAESLFETPDWTQPLKNLEADEMGGGFDGDKVEATGNVKLNLGETKFTADYFMYTQSTGEMHAKGNVLMAHPTGSFAADEVFYTVPPEEQVPPPAPFEAEDEQGRAKRRLTLGRISATNVRITEPTRDLVADHVDYDALSSTGDLTNVRGRNGEFYFGASKLHVLGPRSFEAEDAWLTTCDTEPAPYKIRLKELKVTDGQPAFGKHARLQIRNFDTPFYLPMWRRGTGTRYPWSVDFDSGRRAEIGFFVNVGQRVNVTPDVAVGPRVFATEDEGVGLGGDLEYDFMQTPSSRLYRTKGEVHGLETTENRGYIHWYHRFEPNDELVLRMQAEQWHDRDFYKDFYYEDFRNRTTPRTFANVTYTKPTYIATSTMRLNTHGWLSETERFPEATFHLLDRRIAPHLYFTFDTVNGYNDREPLGGDAARTVNTARLTYDWDLNEAFSVTPFVETDLAWYSKERYDDDSSSRVGSLVGTTVQTRLHKTYDGFWGFSGFKHVIVPSLTYSYRPEPSMSFEDTPRFDALDNSFGRSRIESKIDNIVFGRDAETGEVWQVGRLTLYQGNDFWNEIRKSDDYEIEIDLRPRPWWGMQLVGERHVVNDDLSIQDPFFLQQINLRAYEAIFGQPYDAEAIYLYDAAFNDYNRILAQFYYDETLTGGPLQARVGFAYTETGDRVFNREILYGAGYKFSDKWGLAFEHRYDFEDSELRSQTYEVRRIWSCWESALRVRDRESGTDIDLEFSIKAFPGSRVKL